MLVLLAALLQHLLLEGVVVARQLVLFLEERLVAVGALAGLLERLERPVLGLLLAAVDLARLPPNLDRGLLVLLEEI